MASRPIPASTAWITATPSTPWATLRISAPAMRANFLPSCAPISIAIALLTKGDKQTWREYGAGAGQGVKQGEIRMAMGAFGDGFVKLLRA